MSDDLLPPGMLERLSAQSGVDARPILVRVLTDLFVQKPHHAPEEIARFEELALQLLDVVDVDARAAVARKLAEEPRAPRTLIERLLDDEPLVRAPILARFADVPRQTLLNLALDGGSVEATAVAARSDIDPDVIRILAHHPDELVAETLVANASVTLSQSTLAGLVGRAVSAPALAAALLRRDDFDVAALAPLYFSATPGRRAEIRDALEARPPRPALASRPLRSDLVRDAIAVALGSVDRGALVIDALGEALGLRPHDAARLATEPSGEAFVFMLRAAGLDQNLVARSLLLCQPEIAQDSARFFELVDIVASISRTAAAEIVAALVGDDQKPAAATRREPVFDPSGAMERAGAARPAAHGRRAAARPVEAGRGRG